MTRGFTIQPEAADEANAAFNWYENQQPGLGGEFYRELTRGFEFILENPLLSRVAYRGLRKRKLNRFPYLVVYQVADEEVSVVSVFHGSRNPAVWKRRAPK
jgi:plasmid stabilization system protein ParE